MSSSIMHENAQSGQKREIENSVEILKFKSPADSCWSGVYKVEVAFSINLHKFIEISENNPWKCSFCLWNLNPAFNSLPKSLSREFKKCCKKPAPNLRVNLFSQLSRQHFSIDFTSDSIFLSFEPTSDSEKNLFWLFFRQLLSSFLVLSACK